MAICLFGVSPASGVQEDLDYGFYWHGYNGNPQHLGEMHSATRAWSAAADADRFPQQLDKLSTWQPKKLYLAVAEEESYERVHTHDWTTQCGGRPGTPGRPGGR